MNNIKIDTYKGIDIYLDTESKLFICKILLDSEEDYYSFISEKTYDECIVQIDQLIPATFEPFDVIYISDINPHVTRITSFVDNQFIREDGEQIVKRYMGSYFIVKEENKPFILEYLESIQRQKDFEKKEEALRDDLLSKMKIETLLDYRDKIKK